MGTVWRRFNEKKSIMLLPKITNNKELSSQLINQKIYLALIQQIEKDLQLIGVDFLLEEKPLQEEFLLQFQELITALIDTNFELFLNLLYRIDIDENKIRSLIQSQNENLYALITFEILKREWQKGWFRLNYTN